MGRTMDNTRVIRFGLPGSSDVIGLMPGGRMICVEIKTGKAVQKKEQKNFEEMIRSLGGIYIVVREENDVNLSRYLEDALHGQQID